MAAFLLKVRFRSIISAMVKRAYGIVIAYITLT